MPASGSYAELQRFEREKRAREAAVVPETIAPETTVAPDHSPPRSRSTVAPLARVPQTTDGYTQVPNTLLDDLLPTLDPYEQLVFLRLYRLAWGFGRPECKVGYAKLAEKTRLSRKTIQRTIDRLERRGLIRRVSTDALSADKGSVYEVAGVGEAIAPQTRVRQARAQETHPKDSEKTHETAPMYRLRTIGARLLEAHPAYDAARLEREVCDEAACEGIEYTAGDLAAALAPLVR